MTITEYFILTAAISSLGYWFYEVLTMMNNNFTYYNFWVN